MYFSAVIRCLLAYFENQSPDEMPYIRVPLHTVIKLTNKAHTCVVEKTPLGVDGADTHVEKPRKISSDK